MPGQILLDFDGTVAIEDTTDRLLERFADPTWRDVEADWQAQRIGSRECLSRQVELVRASESDLALFVEDMEVDPGFDAFISTCFAANFSVKIVSDGLDRIVKGVLARTGLHLPVAANRLEHVGGDRWRLAFPHARTECVSASGNCKCAQADRDQPGPRVVVGDGRSDFCVANSADFVFAKTKLRTYCERNGIAHAPIADLGEAATLFRDWHARLPAVSHAAREVTELCHG